MCIQPLLIAVLIVCSTNGFLELFRSWPVATAKSLSLMYGNPEVPCNSLVDMYLGKRSASLMKEFCSFCSLVGDDSIQNGYCGNYPIFEYWSYILFIDLKNCSWAWSPLLGDQHSYVMIFLLVAF